MRQRAHRGGFRCRARTRDRPRDVLAVMRFHRVKDEGGDRRRNEARGEEQPARDIAAGVLGRFFLRHAVVFPVHSFRRSAPR